MTTKALRMSVFVFADYDPEDVHNYTYNCYFMYDEEERGKKTMLYIIPLDNSFQRVIDLRFDKSFTVGREWEYLTHYAHNYWNGVNGAWALKSITISRNID